MANNAKDTAALILSKKFGDSSLDLDEDTNEAEEFDSEYSEEQIAMAEELLEAVGNSDAKGVLDAIHGIAMSYG